MSIRVIFLMLRPQHKKSKVLSLLKKKLTVIIIVKVVSKSNKSFVMILYL